MPNLCVYDDAIFGMDQEKMDELLHKAQINRDIFIDSFSSVVWSPGSGNADDLNNVLKQKMSENISKYTTRLSADIGVGAQEELQYLWGVDIPRGQSSVRYNADMILPLGEKQRIFIEIEFRDFANLCQDLIKFQIGYNAGTLAMGILVIGERKALNISLAAPGFNRASKLLEWLNPSYPIWLISISTFHKANNVVEL